MLCLVFIPGHVRVCMAAAYGRHAGQDRQLGERCIQHGFPILLGGPASVKTKGTAAA